MTVPWYREFMRPAYWAVADWEYTAERTAREVAYLTARLPAPGPLLDAGCGLGRHAAALAGKGWPVLGVDCRTDVLAEARRRHAGPRYACADLFQGVPVRAGSLDAVVCVQAFGWGSDTDQRNLLCGLRDALRPGGTLILDVTNPVCILGAYLPRVSASVAGVRRDFERGYDVASGRSRGTTSGPDGPIAHDIRLYTVPEVRRLLRECGFEVLAVDADFTVDGQVSRDTRYVQFVARRHRLAPAPLASTVESTAAVALDLRWIVEEPALHDPPLDGVFAAVTGRLGVDGARDYHLDDPYGGTRLEAALGLPPGTVTAGAGVSALLAALGTAAAGAPVGTAGSGHPDLPYWAAGRGSRIDVDGGGVPAGGIVCLDRPAADGTVAPPDEVARLAADCTRDGALLVVDESYAAYLDPAERLAPWAARTRSVAVLGGLSKGYGLGGLRVGWLVAHPDTTARLRRHVPPLQVSALSVAVAVEVLADPGRLGPLRSRVRARKPEFVRLLREAGLRLRAGHPAVPWVCLPAGDAGRLGGLGIAGKPCASVSGADWRYVVPLADERWAAAVALLAGAR